MKRQLTLICLLIACAFNLSFAQQLTTVKRDTLNFREKFQVLSANHNVRHGWYMLFSKSSGKVVATGFYKNNQRDSTWREYDRQDHVVTEGRYNAGKKVGRWNYYNERWVVNDTYDFDNDRLLYHRPTKKDSTTTHSLVIGKDTLHVLPERPPIYLGGDAAMFRTLLSNIKYPPEAVKAKAAGRVVIKFIIDEKGLPRDYSVVHGAGYGLDQEALRVVQLIPPNWIAARYRGKTVPAVVTIPVNFNLN